MKKIVHDEEKPLDGDRVVLCGPTSGPHHNIAAFAEAHDIVLERGAKAVFDPVCERLYDGYFRSADKQDLTRMTIHELTKSDSGFLPYYDVVVCLPDIPGEPPDIDTELLVEAAQASGIWVVPLESLM